MSAFSNWSVHSNVFASLDSVGVNVDSLTSAVREAKDAGVTEVTRREGEVRLAAKGGASGTMSETRKFKLDGTLGVVVGVLDRLSTAAAIMPSLTITFDKTDHLVRWMTKSFPVEA